MTSIRKRKICKLLKGIETGDEESVSVINPNKYIQHNPQTHEGRDGLLELFKRLSKSSPRVNIVRIFSDGDYVFAHTEYDFSSRRIGFEIFRFEGDLTVEHWDNIQLRKGPNPSGHTMVDGSKEITELNKTESNRQIVQSFVETILINRQLDKLGRYIESDVYIEHNPHVEDGLSSLYSALSETTSSGDIKIKYEKHHRTLAEGNFVLSVNEGSLNEVHTAFYDLFRIENGKLVEHWDTTEAVPPSTVWENKNGKF